MKPAPDSPTTDPTPGAPEPSRRPPKAWRTFLLIMLLLVVGGTMLAVGRSFGDRIYATLGQIWQDIAGAPPDDEGDDSGNTFFTCGMHPWVILPAPGLCPICHMDLTPLDASKFTGEIAIDPVLAQNIGVRTAVVDTGPLVATVRTVGKVDYDETGLHDVNLRVAGWIEELHVDYLGTAVTNEQPLFELYSPDLYSAQQDYLLRYEQKDLPGVSFVPRVAEDAASALQAARTRLTFYGIDDKQIAELERAGVPSRTMTIRSPQQGTVIEKMAVDGMRVEPGMRMYRIADLDRVWVTVTVYEYQLPFVELGQEARMVLPYVPGQEFTGEVTYIYPWTDEKTRQVNVRLEFDNNDGRLKPGMFANIELRRTLAAERTLVSRSAVIDTGERQVVLMSLGGGRFEPRELKLGIETEGGLVEVLEGLEPGERVVTSGQFLLDSEAKIREGLLRMLRGDLVGNESAGDGPELESQPQALAVALTRALESYVVIGDELASDSAADIAKSAADLAAAVEEVTGVSIPGDEHFWHKHTEVAAIRDKATELRTMTDLAAARLVFFDLSSAFVKLLRATGVPPTYEHEVQELHCPMYQEERGGATWVQHGGSVRNPYYGSEMLVCYDSRETLPVAAEAGDTGPAAAAAAVDEAAIDAIVTVYLRASATLVEDRTDGLDAAWHELHELTARLFDAPGAVADLARKVRDAVPGTGLSIEAARKEFEGLSAAVIELVRVAPAGRPLERAFCPMVDASWLQAEKSVKNPYMGQDMLECGSVKETLPGRQNGGQGR